MGERKLNYFLLIVLWFIFSLAIAYVISSFAEDMTNLGRSRFEEPYSTNRNQFFYEMIIATPIVFIVGVFSWHVIVGRYKRKK